MSAQFAQESVDNIRTVGGAAFTVGGEVIKVAGTKLTPFVGAAMLEGSKIVANALRTLVLMGMGAEPEPGPLPATNTTAR